MEIPSRRVRTPHPGVIVVDDFLTNPMEHREFALKLEYEKKGSYGVRSKTPYPYVEYINHFEQLSGKTIDKQKWHHGVNGCYQWCNRHQDIIWHVDGQDYGAMIYLTPGAPYSSGTSFWESKNSRARIIGSNSNIDLTFGKGAHLKDPSQWNLVDQVGNVFNRLVLFKSKYIHSASQYFGEDVHDSRLFQIFFFYVEK